MQYSNVFTIVDVVVFLFRFVPFSVRCTVLEAPMSVKFEIPYFTVSGVTVRPGLSALLSRMVCRCTTKRSQVPEDC